MTSSVSNCVTQEHKFRNKIVREATQAKTKKCNKIPICSLNFIAYIIVMYGCISMYICIHMSTSMNARWDHKLL